MFTKLHRLFARSMASGTNARARRSPRRKALPPRRLELESLEQRMVLSAISDKYAALGGPSGFLGNALTGELPTPYGGGLYREYQHGAIFWSSATNAHDIYGPIESEFWLTGLEKDALGNAVEKILGLPTNDETSLSGVPGALTAPFQGGVIDWSAATNAHVMYEAIAAKYAATANEKDFYGTVVQRILGVPTSDEENVPGVPGARMNTFQGGNIYWSSSTGANVVYGAILADYAATANERGYDGRIVQTYLGLPTCDETTTGKGDGRFNFFQNGLIIWSPASNGAHVVYGAILAKYASLGYEQSPLGYPTCDETTTGSGNGRFNFFQNGIILWAAATGSTNEVHGPVAAEYAQLGYDTGFLGYPQCDTTTTGKGDGKFNFFQGGLIIWSSASGAHEVHGPILTKYASLGYEQSPLGYPIKDTQNGTGSGDQMSLFEHGEIQFEPSATDQQSPYVLAVYKLPNSNTVRFSWDCLSNYPGSSYHWDGFLIRFGIVGNASAQNQIELDAPGSSGSYDVTFVVVGFSPTPLSPGVTYNFSIDPFTNYWTGNYYANWTDPIIWTMS